MASTKAIPFTITPFKTTSYTANISRKQLHNYLGITSSSPNFMTIMRRLPEMKEKKEIQTNIFAETYYCGYLL